MKSKFTMQLRQRSITGAESALRTGPSSLKCAAAGCPPGDDEKTNAVAVSDDAVAWCFHDDVSTAWSTPELRWSEELTASLAVSSSTTLHGLRRSGATICCR